jgi:hypothetical protein
VSSRRTGIRSRTSRGSSDGTPKEITVLQGVRCTAHRAHANRCSRRHFRRRCCAASRDVDLADSSLGRRSPRPGKPGPGSEVVLPDPNVPVTTCHFHSPLGPQPAPTASCLRPRDPILRCDSCRGFPRIAVGKPGVSRYKPGENPPPVFTVHPQPPPRVRRQHRPDLGGSWGMETGLTRNRYRVGYLAQAS